MTRLPLSRAAAAAAPAVALALALPSLASGQATRTWVSGVGDDVNPCSRTAPCKTFAGAISKTASGGEIDVLDPGGFGTVTITKPITIDGGGSTMSSILGSGTNGININAASSRVTLRNLSINGAGTGLTGVNILAAASVRIDNLKIYGFSRAGVATGYGDTAQHRLNIRNSSIHGNSGVGVLVNNSGPDAPSRVTISRTDIDDNGDGIVADSTTGRAKITVVHSGIADNENALPGSTYSGSAAYPAVTGSGIVAIGANSQVRIGDTDITGNLTGLSSLTGGSILSFGDNHVFANGVDGTVAGKIPLT